MVKYWKLVSNSQVITRSGPDMTPLENLENSRGYVKCTLVLRDDFQVDGAIIMTTNGVDPFGIAFDSVNVGMYVTNSFFNSTLAISGITNGIVKNITVGSYPTGIAFDTNGYTYVTNSGSNSVSVINTTTNTVVKNITVGSYPTGIAFDTDGNIYVANSNSGTISIISTVKEVDFITFMKSGISYSTSWSVTLNGTTKTSTSGTITFTVVNGTYSYTISNVTGYTLSPPSGNITVNNDVRTVTVYITFMPTERSNIEIYVIIGIVVAIAVIGSAILLIRRRE